MGIRNYSSDLSKSGGQTGIVVLKARTSGQHKVSDVLDCGYLGGSRDLMKQSNFMIGIHRSKCRKLPWWKRFWLRLFGAKTPDYTAGNYD